MKKESVIVNTSRGPIIKEHDLIDALNNNIRKIDLFTKTYQPIEVEFTSSIDQFFNINTPEDLEIAKKIFEESKI